MTLQETAGDTADSFDDDAALMAELDALDAAGSDAQDSEQLADAETQPEDGAEVEETDEEVTSEEEAEEVADKPEEEAKPEDVPDVDAKLAKRLETIQAAEERSKSQIDDYRAQADKLIADKEAEWAPRIEAAENFESLKAQVHHDLPGVLSALGVRPEDYNAHARLLHSISPEGMKDPRYRDAAQREMQRRQQGSALSEIQAELKALKDANAARDTAAAEKAERDRIESEVKQHVDRFSKAVGDQTPIVQQYMKTNPEAARAGLRKAADDLVDEYGELPSDEDVAKRFEQDRRKLLTEMGIDPDAALQANTKTKPSDAGEKKAAKTLTGNLGTPTRPQKAPETEEEIDAEIAKGLDELDNL